MRLLLDTSAFLWFVEGSPRLSHSAKDQIENSDNEVFLSIASLWEMAIKISLGTLELPSPFLDFVQKHLSPNSIDVLGIKQADVAAIATLPFHHRDPSDRMLAVQCLNEKLTLIAPDPVLSSTK